MHTPQGAAPAHVPCPQCCPWLALGLCRPSPCVGADLEHRQIWSRSEPVGVPEGRERGQPRCCWHLEAVSGGLLASPRLFVTCVFFRILERAWFSVSPICGPAFGEAVVRLQEALGAAFTGLSTALGWWGVPPGTVLPVLELGPVCHVGVVLPHGGVDPGPSAGSTCGALVGQSESTDKLWGAEHSRQARVPRPRGCCRDVVLCSALPRGDWASERQARPGDHRAC